jgi:hypothetical protein
MRGTPRAAAGVPAAVPHTAFGPGRDERGAPAATAARAPQRLLAPRQARRAPLDGCPRATHGAGSTARGSAGAHIRPPGSFRGEGRAAVPGRHHRPRSARGALAAQLRQGRG